MKGFALGLALKQRRRQLGNRLFSSQIQSLRISIPILTCPTKMFPAADKDSAADIPMVTCMTQEILEMTSCITPQ